MARDPDQGWQTVSERDNWLAAARVWNRRLSIGVAMLAGAVILMVMWAEAIRFGGWLGVFFGWWPAMFVASAAAFVIGRVWQSIASIAGAALVAGRSRIVAN